MSSLVCALPSPASAEGRPSLFGWFIGTTAQSGLLLHVHVRRSVYGLRGPVLIRRPRRAGDLPVLVHVVSQRARVLRLRRTDKSLAIDVVVVLPSSLPERSRHPVPNGLFEAQSPGPPIPLSTLQARPPRLEARMDSLLPFPVGLFHPLQHAGLSRRTPSTRHPGTIPRGIHV